MDVDYANDKGSYRDFPDPEGDGPDARSRSSPGAISGARKGPKPGPGTGANPESRTFGLLSQISPDGRFVLSTVKDRSIFVAKDDFHYSQLFFPVKGILACTTGTRNPSGRFRARTIPRFVQSNPVWSPDGRNRLFLQVAGRTAWAKSKNPTRSCCRPRRRPISSKAERDSVTTFTACRSTEEGAEGPSPWPAPRGNGMSNFFPRPSPDGKWIVFTQVEEFHAAAAGQPARHRSLRRRDAPRHELQHRLDELVAFVVAERPMARLRVEDARTLHGNPADPRGRGRERQRLPSSSRGSAFRTAP